MPFPQDFALHQASAVPDQRRVFPVFHIHSATVRTALSCFAICSDLRHHPHLAWFQFLGRNGAFTPFWEMRHLAAAILLCSRFCVVITALPLAVVGTDRRLLASRPAHSASFIKGWRTAVDMVIRCRMTSRSARSWYSDGELFHQ
jgi:hypothetical protein